MENLNATTGRGKLLTVLLITYNHREFIRKSIESLLEQETDFPFTIRVIDDCSTDGTSDIVREYAEKHPDKIEHQRREKNLGITDNIYAGLCSLDTPYFATIEGDDWWCDKTKAQTGVDILERETDCVMMGTNTRQMGNPHHEFIVDPRDIKAGRVPRKFRLSNDVPAPYLHVSSRIFRRVFDFSQLDKYIVTWDSGLYTIHLDKGFCYYDDKVTSVYNCTNPTSIYYTRGRRQRQFSDYVFQRKLCALFDYKYDKPFVDTVDPKLYRVFDAFRQRIGAEKTWENLLDFDVVATVLQKEFMKVEKGDYGLRHSLLNLVSSMLGFGKIFRKMSRREHETVSSEILVFDSRIQHSPAAYAEATASLLLHLPRTMLIAIQKNCESRDALVEFLTRHPQYNSKVFPFDDHSTYDALLAYATSVDAACFCNMDHGMKIPFVVNFASEQEDSNFPSFSTSECGGAAHSNNSIIQSVNNSILSHPLCRKVIVATEETRGFLIDNSLCPAEKIELVPADTAEATAQRAAIIQAELAKIRERKN